MWEAEGLPIDPQGVRRCLSSPGAWAQYGYQMPHLQASMMILLTNLTSSFVAAADSGQGRHHHRRPSGR